MTCIENVHSRATSTFHLGLGLKHGHVTAVLAASCDAWPVLSRQSSTRVPFCCKGHSWAGPTLSTRTMVSRHCLFWHSRDACPTLMTASSADMPPLVDNPYPSMTFTFTTNMTPITYSTDQNSFELTPEATAPGTFLYEPPPLVDEPTTKAPHSKKKDESYIPRPPNAFILFRSSFIKAQHIPEKIEGNHSALSKIIGAPAYFSRYVAIYRLNLLRKILEDSASRRKTGVGDEGFSSTQRA